MKDERGQAIAEMAIALPVLLTLLCGIIDFGWLFTNQLTLSYCSREGARYGIVNPDGTDAAQDITDRVLSIAPDYIRDKMSVLVTFSDEPSRRGDVLTWTERRTSRF
jgi:Flp pilus assembly protein TadG